MYKYRVVEQESNHPKERSFRIEFKKYFFSKWKTLKNIKGEVRTYKYEKRALFYIKSINA